MKVKKNDPTYPVTTGNMLYHRGVPIRLEIASRMIEAMLMNDSFDFKLLEKESVYEKALIIADRLIIAHNQTCNEETIQNENIY